MGSSRSELGDLLAKVSELVANQRAEFETGPVHASATLDELRVALGGPTPETRDRRRDRRHRARGSGRPRAVGHPGAALLRVRHRRQPPGRARGRLAHQRLGQQRRSLRGRARGGGDRGDREPLAPRSARAAAHGVRRLRHRRHDGQLHRAGRGPPPGARRRGLGRRRRRIARRAACPRRRRRGAARDDRHRVALPGLRRRDGRAGSRRRTRPHARRRAPRPPRRR